MIHKPTKEPATMRDKHLHDPPSSNTEEKMIINMFEITTGTCAIPTQG